jgi:L-fuconate dehydratase
MLADMEPERLVRCLDFRFVMDALTPAEATALARAFREPNRDKERHVHATSAPGFSVEFIEGVLAEHEYPNGQQWKG